MRVSVGGKPPLMVGQTISHYRIVEKIGEGGMGVVYKATDTRLGRPVAIKLLTSARLAHRELKQRFTQEAKAASALNHPNIITIYDIGAAGDEPFIAMEFVRGKTLHQCIDGKGLPLPDVIKYLTPVADALSRAHMAGIVHRDLKPANIMVGDNGVVKLLDFGVAKLSEPVVADASAATATAEKAMTEPGAILGTVEYMSPEQALGEPVDQRTDVWAFGCVFFESLTGQRPFGRGSRPQILARILDAEPDWTTLPATTPSTIRQLLRNCLRKDPQRRLRHLDPALLDISDERPQPTAPARPSHIGWQMALVGATLVFGAVLGWFVSAKRTPSIVASQPVVRLNPAFVGTGQDGEFGRPVLAAAPDGSSIVYVGKSGENGRQLYLKRMNRVDGVPLPGTDDALNPFFSPDAKWVGFFAGGKLKRISVADGAIHTVCDHPPAAFGAAWGSDDVIVFSGGLSRPGAGAQPGGLLQVPASGGTPRTLTSPGAGEVLHRWPSLLPGGRVVVYTTTNSTAPGLEEPRLVAQSLDSGKRTILPVQATYAVFVEGGRQLLLARNGAVSAVAFDPVRLEISGSPVPVMEGVMQSSTGAAQLSAERSLLAYLPGAPETRRLVWVDRRGRVVPVEAPPRLYVHPRLSPDGQRIAVAITEPKNDIWVYEIARNHLWKLTSEGGNAYPIWTPDGRKITYVSRQQGHPPNVFWKSSDGTGAEERLLTSANTQVTESWLPRGETLLFVELRPPPKGWDILYLSLSNPGKPTEFLSTPFLDGTPQISPSGRYLAHTSGESGVQEVHVRAFPGPGVRLPVGIGGQPAWRRDERELYYRSAGQMMVASVTTEPRLEIGKSTMLFEGQFAHIQGKNYDVRPDGQRFLMVVNNPLTPPREMTVVLNWMEEVKSRLSAK